MTTFKELAKRKDYKKMLKELKTEKRCIIGIDIYKYSKMDPINQKLTPYIFDCIYKQTVEHLFDAYKTIFQNIKKDDFISAFVHTGDGGFQIADDPFIGLIFLINFSTNVVLFNSKLDPEFDFMGKKFKPITLRYCITYDELYQYEPVMYSQQNRANFFGSAIIKCARILSLDKLDRLLIDGDTYEWFVKKFHTIENIRTLNLDIICKKLNLKPQEKDVEGKNVTFSPSGNTIKNIIAQKIDALVVKESEFNVFNFFIQFETIVCIEKPNKKSENVSLTVSLGNVNSSGLSAEK